MTYAVGVAPHTAERAMRLRNAGVDLKLLLDSPEQATMLGEAGRAAAVTRSAFIEIDCDGHRGGLTATDPKLIAIATALAEAGVKLAGILTTPANPTAFARPMPSSRLRRTKGPWLWPLRRRCGRRLSRGYTAPREANRQGGRRAGRYRLGFDEAW